MSTGDRVATRERSAGHGDPGRTSGAAPRDDGATVVTRAARGLLAELPALAAELASRLIVRDDYYRMCAEDLGPAFTDELTRSAREHMGQTLRGLVGDEPVDFEKTRVLARARAAAGVPISSLLHAYRLAAELYWERVVEPGRNLALDPIGPASVLDAAAQVWSLADEYTLVISDAYLETATEQLRHAEEGRGRALDALFGGASTESPPLGQVANQLALPLRGAFVVVVAQGVPAGRSGADLEATFAAAGLRSVWRRVASGHQGVVVLDEPLDAGVGGVGAFIGRLVEPRSSTRVGVSPRFHALADCADQVSLAELARRATTGHDPVVACDEQPLAILIGAAPDVAERGARIVLGDLLGLPPSARDLLLETLGAWLDAGGSVQRAAQQLYCHRNTVRNRLVRVEELTKRSLQDPSAVAELVTAVLALRATAPDQTR